MRHRLVTAVLTAGIAAWACGGGGGAGSDGFGGERPATDAGFDGSGFGAGGTTGTGGTGGGALPPEQEVESSFRSPVATGRFVWSTNPDSGRVALVDAESLEVTTVEAGFEPTFLAAVPDAANPEADRAIVINVRSHDATFLQVEGNTIVPPPDPIPLHEGATSWTVAESGRWAIAWSDATQSPNADPTEGFQDITVIDLATDEPRPTRLSVGYRPVSIVIAEGEQRAYAVTEPGVSVIELEDEPFVSRDVPLTDDPLDDPASRDVSITPDGTLAFVRRAESPDVNVVTLPDGAIRTVTLSAPVTDLDLSADGSFAVAVVRETSEIVVLAIPRILDDPTNFVAVPIEGELFGSVSLSPDGSRALLFTNAIPNDRLVIVDAVVGPDYLTHRTVALKAPIQAVVTTPDARHAVAVLQPNAGSSRGGAFGIVPIATDLPPKIQGTDAPPVSVAMPQGGRSDRALVTTRDDGADVHEAYLLRMPDLRVDRTLLPSPPLATGTVPRAGVGFVAQEHPEGRITFIELEQGDVRTLTGFELDAQVIDGT